MLLAMRWMAAVSVIGFFIIAGLYTTYARSDSRIAASCARENTPVLCFINEADEIARTRGIEAALAFAVKYVAPYSRNALHMSMHMIGRQAYAQTKDRKSAIKFLPMNATTGEEHLIYDGFQHGLLQAYFLDHKNDLSPRELVDESCGEFNVPENDPRGERPWRAALACFHGTGHALMTLLDNDEKQSILVCDSLSYNWMKQRCAYGVFMEVSYAYFPAHGSHGSHSAHADRPMTDVCKEAPALKEVCAQFVGHAHLMNNPRDYSGAFKTCTEIPFEDNDECRIYLSEVIIPGVAKSADEIITHCSQSGAFEDKCLLWAAYGISEGYGSGVEGADTFCSKIPTALHASCGRPADSRLY